MLPVLTLDEKIDNLTRESLKQPQEELPVVHRFYPGMYIREMEAKAGLLVIGHYHTTRHMNRLVKGRGLFLQADGSVVEKCAPLSFMSEPGRKVAIVLEDMVFQNIYETDETNVEVLEQMYLDTGPIWEEHLKQQLYIEYDNSADVEDYYKALAEWNLDPVKVRQITEYTADQIPFPAGGYKVQLGDSKIEGKGLFACGNIADGEVIAPVRINECRTPAGRYTNHSKTPNAKFVLKENNDLELVALRNISGKRGGQLGEEITIDYRQALSLYKERLICLEV